MTNYDLIIRNGHIVTSESVAKGDIAIKDGKIAEVSINKEISAKGVNEINAEGLHVFPGFNRFSCAF